MLAFWLSLEDCASQYNEKVRGLESTAGTRSSEIPVFFGVKFHHVAVGVCDLTIMMMLTPNGPGNSEFQIDKIHFRNFSWDILWPKVRHCRDDELGHR